MGNYIQKPLENAAQEVGIAKKTLDDYLLQIRNGKKYGFNFNEKVNSKIGELRAFVRDEKKKEGIKWLQLYDHSNLFISPIILTSLSPPINLFSKISYIFLTQTIRFLNFRSF